MTPRLFTSILLRTCAVLVVLYHLTLLPVLYSPFPSDWESFEGEEEVEVSESRGEGEAEPAEPGTSLIDPLDADYPGIHEEDFTSDVFYSETYIAGFLPQILLGLACGFLLFFAHRPIGSLVLRGLGSSDETLS